MAVSTTATATFNEAVQSSTITFTLTPSGGSPVAASLSYNSTTDTATLTPSSALAYNTSYTASVSGAKDSAGDPMSSPFSWSFTTVGVPPSVTSESPAKGATNVAVSTTATATFNEAVQSSTITFTLTPSGGSPVAASLSYNSTTDTATLTPSSALAYNTSYTASVSGAKSTTGVAMSSPFSWSFTTDVAPPSVTSESPAKGATNVAVSTTATATFNEAVQSSTITFTLTPSGGSPIAASLSYNSTTDTATLTPKSALAYNTSYTASVSGAKDSAGDPMSSPFSWSFTTDVVPPSVTSESPTKGATNVAVSTTATATFNEAVQSSTITFTLTPSGGSPIAASLSYNSTTDTATLTPKSALAYNTSYTASVSGAKDSAGDPMSSPFSWSFTTVPASLTTYYVATTGSDKNNGSKSSPFATFQHAMMSLQPGDTLDVESGSYAGFISGWDSTPASSGDPYGYIDGTAGNPITIQADPSAPAGSVIIDSRDNKTAVGIDLEPADNYITISGLTIEDGDGSITRAGFKVTGTNDSLINNTVTGVGGFGILADNANNVLLQGNTVSGTTGSGATGHGIYISGSTNDAVVEGNTIANNGYIGIHVDGDASEGGLGLVTNALIEDNVIYGNGQNGINADGLQNSTIENNLIYNYQDYGICLYQVNASGPSKNNIIVDNTIDYGTSSGAGAALRILDGSTGNTVLNNILLGGGGITIRISSDSMSGLTSNYNVVESLFQSEDTGNTESLAQWQSSTGQDAKSFTATPSQLFVNPSGNNYQELSTSPSIGAGTATDSPSTDILGNPRPSSYGYDIGAYEYKGSSSGAPTVVSESPGQNASNVNVSTTATATFNEAVQPSTITFTLTPKGGSPVAASDSYNTSTDTVTLTPKSALAYNTSYTVTVSGAKSTTGVIMSSPFSWSFTTEVKPPSITSESPANKAPNVSVTTKVTATFNEAVQASSIVFTLKNHSGGTVSAALSYNSTTHTAALAPRSSLAYSTTYTATVSGAKDSAGDPMPGPFSWSFTTPANPKSPAMMTLLGLPSSQFSSPIAQSSSSAANLNERGSEPKSTGNGSAASPSMVLQSDFPYDDLQTAAAVNLVTDSPLGTVPETVLTTLARARLQPSQKKPSVVGQYNG